eukprot:scaffold5742_cov183-Skeletonema_menzelii.AAC.1
MAAKELVVRRSKTTISEIWPEHQKTAHLSPQLQPPPNFTLHAIHQPTSFAPTDMYVAQHDVESSYELNNNKLIAMQQQP